MGTDQSLPSAPVVTPAVHYRDPIAALDWLARCFGFEVTMAIGGPGDPPENCHFEMSCSGGRGRIMVGAEWAEFTASPASVGGRNTQTIHVELNGEVDEHCAAARAAGAEIAAEPEDQFYGDRSYRAVDLEGHRWTFSQRVRDVSRADAEAAIGMSIVSADWK